jgi:hypothetical protein
VFHVYRRTLLIGLPALCLAAQAFAQTGPAPYRGVAPANVDWMAGQTQAMFPSLADAFPAYVKADIDRWSKQVKDQKIEIES